MVTSYGWNWLGKSGFSVLASVRRINLNVIHRHILDTTQACYSYLGKQTVGQVGESKFWVRELAISMEIRWWSRCRWLEVKLGMSSLFTRYGLWGGEDFVGRFLGVRGGWEELWEEKESRRVTDSRAQHRGSVVSLLRCVCVISW